MVSCGRHQRPDQPERCNVAGIGCYITTQNNTVRARYQPAAKDKSKEIAPTPLTNGAANGECEIFEGFSRSCPSTRTDLFNVSKGISKENTADSDPLQTGCTT